MTAADQLRRDQSALRELQASLPARVTHLVATGRRVEALDLLNEETRESQRLAILKARGEDRRRAA